MKKNVQQFLLVLVASLIFIACQKELNFPDQSITVPGSNGGTATYAFAGGTGTCSAAVISGTYKKGTVLNDSNLVVIKVQVDSIGTYTIATANINGVVFTGSGSFTATGLQSITLKGSGTPLAAGSFIYIPGSAGCTFTIVCIANGANSGTALYTLNGAPDSCTSAVISGSYLQGIFLDATDTIVIKATVATTGSYSITTNAANGILFSASGTFTATGQQNITLLGSGKPSAAGTFIFTPGTNGCQFKINCIAAPTTDCKSCVYIPTCPGSTYIYTDSITILNFPDTESIVTANVRESDFLTSTDTVMNAVVYKKIAATDGTNVSYTYVNCFNGETRAITYNGQSATSGNTTGELNIIELKANAAVGVSWTDTSAIDATDNLYRTSTILQKGISRTFAGVTYNDVIKVGVVQAVGTQPAGITEYYFAKGIGLVELVGYGTNPFTNQQYVTVHTVLTSYIIP